MIKPPSIQGTYSLVWSGDPALNLPDVGPERDRVLTDARDRGDWSGLIIAGQQPTVFHFRKLPKSVFDWVIGEHTSSSRFKRPLSEDEGYTLLFRAALKSIDNWPGYEKIRPESFGEDCPVIAHESVTNALAAIDPNDPTVGASLIGELAILVLRKERSGIGPKS